MSCHAALGRPEAGGRALGLEGLPAVSAVGLLGFPRLGALLALPFGILRLAPHGHLQLGFGAQHILDTPPSVA